MNCMDTTELPASSSRSCSDSSKEFEGAVFVFSLFVLDSKLCVG